MEVFGKRSPWSLHARLMLAASIALVCFLGLTGAVLDAAFRESARSALHDRLQGHIYTLLAVVEVAGGELVIPAALPEARFTRPASGLYAKISGQNESWQSLSATAEGLDLPVQGLAPGVWRFDEHVRHRDEEMFILSLGVVFEADDKDKTYTISVAEDEQIYATQVSGFRGALWAWLGAAAVVLLAVQGSVLRWSLTPMREISDELAAVEAGARPQFKQDYPRELQGLAGNLNAFIASERNHLDRYRNSLSDLAHSLKTPLTVLRSGIETSDRGEAPEWLGQLDRMDAIVAHQLQRARVAGHLTFDQPLAVAGLAEQVVSSLEKVYRHKAVQCSFELQEAVKFYGGEGDLFEVLGNLLDNAFKWCGQQVVLRAQALRSPQFKRPGLRVVVEDDGPGMAADTVEAMLQRGVRADQRVAGHGIGLAMTRDIVAAYGGTISVAASDLGGACVEVVFPPRGAVA